MFVLRLGFQFYLDIEVLDNFKFHYFYGPCDVEDLNFCQKLAEATIFYVN